MPRATTKLEVSERFEKLLKSTLSEFNSRIYWMMDERAPTAAMADAELLTFCWLGGQTDYAAQVGGGTIVYQGTIRVKLWAVNQSDERGSNRELFFAEPRGLYLTESKLLTVVENVLPDSESTRGDKDMLLLHGIKFLSDSEGVGRLEDQDDDSWHGVLMADFGLDFEWGPG